jgi:ATP-dependent Zn protease
LATTRQGQTVLVALPNRPDLIQLLTNHRVDIFVQPPSDDRFSQGIASMVCGSEQPQTHDTWRYSQFVQAVQSQTVARVRISADRSRAWVTTRDGQTVRVNLPNDPDLINLLTTHGVEISVSYSPGDESF